MSKKYHIIGWLIIILIIVGFVIFVVKYSKVELGDNIIITFSPPKGKIFNKQVDYKKAILSLFVEQEEIKAGDEIKVNIILDTQSQPVDGVDVILKYDPLVLKAQDKEVKKGEVFTNFMTNEINQETGIIKFSALSQPGQAFTGQGVLAFIDFQALKQGQTPISFVFEPASTQDTNVASQSKDILKEVRELGLNIK